MNPKLYQKARVAWRHMKERCLNSDDKWFHRYGGRGISICDAWMDPQIFISWCSKNGIADGLSIDRIDNDGNYEPSNCRWTTQSEQRRNSISAKLITFNGETLTQREWGYRLGIGDSGMAWRFNNWSLEKALTAPRKKIVRLDTGRLF